MKLTEILKDNKLSLSFEVFPPKTEMKFDSVKSAIEEIAKMKPAFMSVTYGAGGGTSRYTLEIAESIRKNLGVPTLAHLTCVSSSKQTVRKMIEDMKNAGIENVMALRGDLTDEIKASDMSMLDYRYAVDLVREIKQSGADFCIGGACYPEVHPESFSRREDLIHLKEKVDAGCDFLTTQMFFENDLLYSFLYSLMREGINVPVIAGIMPITSAKQVERAISLSGSYIPKPLMTLTEKFGSDPKAMYQAGIAYAVGQIIDLYANGVTHVHVYTMNKPDVAMKIKESLSDIIGK